MKRPDPVRVARKYGGLFSLKFDTEKERTIDKWIRSNRSRWSKMVDQAHWLNDDRYNQPLYFFWSELPEDLKELLAPKGILKGKPDPPFKKAVINYLIIKALRR